MKRIKLKFFAVFSACFFSLAAGTAYAEETKITTVTTIETDGQVKSTVQSEAQPASVPQAVPQVINEPQHGNVPPQYSGGSNGDAFRSQLSITRMLTDTNGLEKNSQKIEDRSRDLTVEQKYLLLNQYKKEGGLPFVINFLIGLGIGSFIQGDTVGGWTGLIGELGSVGLIVAGQMTGMSYYGYYSSYTLGTVMLIGGVASLIGFRVYELVRPWTYAKSYNEKLEQSLRLAVRVQPYVNVAETLGPVYGVGLTAYF